ncbi:MAG: FAD-dependent oxidoreductase, partial [Cyanobacteria bacterium MAG IRC1_bin_28]|nr:FAD-dependent oxidoreductase [Cyanobacteria bacterium MAG IRC1_bin_28]
IEALDQLMPSFDADIRKLATRHLIEARDIETYTGVLASKVTPGSPVRIELRHAASKELVDTLEVDGVLVATGRAPVSRDLNLASVGVATERGFIPVDERLRVLADGEPVEGLWAVGDVTGKLMLAHAAAAQGIVAVENILGHGGTMDYRSIPAVTFTHPEISSVGLTQEQAQAEAGEQGFELGSVRSYFRANAKALAEAEGDGLMKLLFRRDNGRVLGAQIYGLHAGDLIQEVANAMAAGQSVQQLSRAVHTHPTLSEVVEVAYKQAAAALSS